MRVVPTLSSKGWARTPEERMDKIILYYMSMNYSQTLRYRDSVKSLQYAIFRAGDDMKQLANIVTLDLESLLGNNFPEGAVVNVNCVTIDGNDARYDLRISAVVSEGGKEYDLATVLRKIDSDFVRIHDVGEGTPV